MASDSNVALVQPAAVRTVRGMLENGTSDNDASTPARRVRSRFVKNPRVGVSRSVTLKMSSWTFDKYTVTSAWLRILVIRSPACHVSETTGSNGGSGPSSNGSWQGSSGSAHITSNITGARNPRP